MNIFKLNLLIVITFLIYGCNSTLPSKVSVSTDIDPKTSKNTLSSENGDKPKVSSRTKSYKIIGE